MKKILSIMVVILLIAGMAFGLWYFFFRNLTEENGDQPFTEEVVSFGNFFDTESGRNENYNGQLTEQPSVDALIPGTRIPILRQLSFEPVAGYGFFEKEFEVLNDLSTSTEELETEEKIIFRFMERATGHVFETTEDSLSVKKITNTTIQKVYNAFFSEDGNNIIFEKLSLAEEGTDSFYGEIAKESTTTDDLILKTSPYSIISSNFNKLKNEDLFSYVIKNNNSSSIFVDNLEEPSENEVINTPLRELLIDWVNSNNILITTKPSYDTEGFSYLLDINRGTMTKILTNIKGLTALVSPDEELALFSETIDRFPTLKTRDLSTGEEIRLAILTLPEKCVFSNVSSSTAYCAAPINAQRANYPDDWYMGKVFFNDRIWKIDTRTNLLESVYSFNIEDYSFDVIDLSLTNNDEYLVFKNKRDLTLWTLNLAELNNEDVFIEDSPEVF